MKKFLTLIAITLLSVTMSFAQNEGFTLNSSTGATFFAFKGDKRSDGLKVASTTKITADSKLVTIVLYDSVKAVKAIINFDVIPGSAERQEDETTEYVIIKTTNEKYPDLVYKIVFGVDRRTEEVHTDVAEYSNGQKISVICIKNGIID